MLCAIYYVFKYMGQWLVGERYMSTSMFITTVPIPDEFGSDDDVACVYLKHDALVDLPEKLPDDEQLPGERHAGLHEGISRRSPL